MMLSTERSYMGIHYLLWIKDECKISTRALSYLDYTIKHYLAKYTYLTKCKKLKNSLQHAYFKCKLKLVKRKYVFNKDYVLSDFELTRRHIMKILNNILKGVILSVVSSIVLTLCFVEGILTTVFSAKGLIISFFTIVIISILLTVEDIKTRLEESNENIS